MIAAHTNLVRHRVQGLMPGLALCLLVTIGAYAAQRLEREVLGRAWLEALVLAILAGTAIRSAWSPGERFSSGIAFSAKILLEIAEVLLGASVSAGTVLAAGPGMLLGIAAVVIIAIGASFLIGRLLGLPARLALLVACGNSICGNSAIAAVAPVIDADSDDVAASIGFTAVLGVVVVLGLPVIGMALHLGGLRYGAFAGLTVYAVPQVIAATAPAGAAAVQMGTLVKLVRVLMLGPVCVALALLAPNLRPLHSQLASTGVRERSTSKRSVPLHQFVPWFIVGFLVLMGTRSAGFIPTGLLAPMSNAATLLTVVSMAALGLSVEVRSVAHAGTRVAAAVVLSLLTLGAISLALVRALGLH